MKHISFNIFYAEWLSEHMHCKVRIETLTDGLCSSRLVPITWPSFPQSVWAFALCPQLLGLSLVLLGFHIQPCHIQHLQGAAHGLHLLFHRCALGTTCRSAMRNVPEANNVRWEVKILTFLRQISTIKTKNSWMSKRIMWKVFPISKIPAFLQSSLHDLHRKSTRLGPNHTFLDRSLAVCLTTTLCAHIFSIII